MSESVLTLARVYKGWDRHHHLLREVVKPLSAEQLALRAAPQVRSIGEEDTPSLIMGKFPFGTLFTIQRVLHPTHQEVLPFSV